MKNSHFLVGGVAVVDFLRLNVLNHGRGRHLGDSLNPVQDLRCRVLDGIALGRQLFHGLP